MPFGLDIFRRRTSRRADKAGHTDVDRVIADLGVDWNNMTGLSERPQKVPAWALHMRVPYDPRPPSGSFLGGLPRAPERLAWPRDERGRPLWFAGQIDLSEIRPEPQTGATPPGLPRSGALLMFFGSVTRCAIIDAHDMAEAREHAVPADLAPLQDGGFAIEGCTFPRWHIDIAPYLDTASPAGEFTLPADPPFDPATEIFTWADAALEARATLRRLEFCLQGDRDFLERQLSTVPQTASGRDRLERDREAWTRTLSLLRTEAPAMEKDIERWRAACLEKPPGEPADPAALGAIFDRRRALADGMAEFTTKHVFRGRRDDMWMEFSRIHRPARADRAARRDLGAVPPEHRDYVRAYVSRWRGHSLFGHGLVRHDLGHDLRGMDPVFTIRADALLGTVTDHDCGFSGWFIRQDIASARFGEGRLIRHDVT